MVTQSRIICNKLARLIFLQYLIPPDGHFEPELSLALDRALVDLEQMNDR